MTAKSLKISLMEIYLNSVKEFTRVNSNVIFPWWKKKLSWLGKKGKFPIIMQHSKWMSEYVRKEKFVRRKMLIIKLQFTANKLSERQRRMNDDVNVESWNSKSWERKIFFLCVRKINQSCMLAFYTVKLKHGGMENWLNIN